MQQAKAWVKRHVDTVLVFGTMFGGIIWMNGRFNEMEREVSRIKTILIINKLMPPEMAENEKNWGDWR